jgi:hypothetical protein
MIRRHSLLVCKVEIKFLCIIICLCIHCNFCFKVIIIFFKVLCTTFFFSSPGPTKGLCEVLFSLCICQHLCLLDFHIFIFFSQTTIPIESKLCRNVTLLVLIILYDAIAGNSLDIRPDGKIKKKFITNLSESKLHEKSLNVPLPKCFCETILSKTS